MSSTTRIVETAHGEVTYETVECASCGAEVSADDAARFAVGPEQDRHERAHDNTVRLEFDRAELAEGWACSYCREEGPADYPTAVTSRLGRAYRRHVLDDSFDAMRLGVFLYLLLSMSTISFLLVALAALTA